MEADPAVAIAVCTARRIADEAENKRRLLPGQSVETPLEILHQFAQMNDECMKALNHSRLAVN